MKNDASDKTKECDILLDKILSMHKGLTDYESHKLNAKIIMLLINKVPNHDFLWQSNILK